MTIASRSAVADRSGAAATTDPRHLDAAVPVVRTLSAVRVEGHPVLDRVVLDLDGAPPGVDVRYVDQVVEDRSGRPVALGGSAFLRVCVFPASTAGAGAPRVPLPRSGGLAAVRGIAPSGDVEAVVSFGLGLAARTPFVVRRLASPSRVVIDVAHPAPGTGARLLRRGDHGAAVATWQWRLGLVMGTAIGPALPVDEDFGRRTAAATRDFQHACGLAVDGVVGARTRAAMERALGL